MNNCMQKSPLELLRSGTAKESFGGKVKKKGRKDGIVRNPNNSKPA